MSSQALAPAAPAPAATPAGQPALAGADLPTHRVLAGALLGLAIAATIIALAAVLGILFSSAVYGYGGLG